MPTTICARNCWIAGAALGLFVWVMNAGVGHLAWFEGLVLGVMAMVLATALLLWLVCHGGAQAWTTQQTVAPAEVFSPAPLADPRPVAPTPTAAAVSPNAPETQAAPAQVPVPDTIAVAEDRVDDLKRVKGIGPKIEGLLHDHGVTRFDQIAAWSENDVDRFAERLGALGHRIRSEDWRGQASHLASEGRG